MRKYSSLLSGSPKDQKGQTTGINISIRVIIARPVLPAETFLTFNVAVCIIAGWYSILFSALELLLSTKVI